jgi:hypothetical protein
MFNPILHHARKDVGRWRWLIAAYLAVLALSHIAHLLAPRLTFLFPRGERFEYFAMLLGLICSGTIVTLVVVLIQEDPPHGNTAWWLTRPISARDLLFSKLLLAAVLFVIAPVVFGLLAVLAAGLSLGHALSAVPGVTLAQAFFVVPILVAAAVTTTLAQFVMVALFGLLVFTVVNTGFSYYVPAVLLTAGSQQIFATRVTLALAVTLIAGAGILAHQYTWRNPRRSFLLAFGVAMIAIAIMRFWPWSLFATAEAAGLDASLNAGAIQVSVDGRHVNVDNLGVQAELNGAIQIAGLPTDVVVEPRWIDWHLRDASGNVLTGLEPERARRLPFWAPETRWALQSPQSPSLGIDPRGQPDSPTTVRVTFARIRRRDEVAAGPATYTGRTAFRAYRQRIVGTLPLREGAYAADALRRIRISRVDRAPDRSSVELWETSIRPPLGGTWQYPLVFYVVPRAGTQVSSFGLADSWLPTGVLAASRQVFLPFTKEEASRLDETTAELIVVEERSLGQFEKTLSIPQVQIRSDGATSQGRPR